MNLCKFLIDSGTDRSDHPVEQRVQQDTHAVQDTHAPMRFSVTGKSGVNAEYNTVMWREAQLKRIQVHSKMVSVKSTMIAWL